MHHQIDLRGFERFKVGPVDYGDFVGGNYVATLNLSAELPILESLDTIRLILFMMLQMFGE